MWQLRCVCVVVIAGLLGMALVAGARGARADDSSLLPSFFALNGPPDGDLPSLPRGEAACIVAGVRGSAADALTESLRPVWTAGWCSAGGVQDARSVLSSPAPLASMSDLSMALAEIRAAAAGSWSWED